MPPVHSGDASYATVQAGTLASAMARGNRSLVAVVAIVGLAAVVTAVGVVGGGVLKFGGSSTTTTTTTQPNPLAQVWPQAERAVAAAEKAVGVALPRREGAPAPALRPGVSTGVGRHEVVGFVPAYELTRLAGVPFSDYSELVFSSVGLLGSGALDRGSFGYTMLANGAARSLVVNGHHAGDPVLLSLAQVNQPIIDSLVASPASHAAVTADQVAALLQSGGFDGVDLDVEGQNAADRAGFTKFVAALAADLHARNPSWTLLVNTYPDSAVNPQGFFDVQALAGAATQLFVMAYDMNDQQIPSATAPLTGTVLSDATVLASYVRAGLGSKVILGIPFYGYDYPASRAGVPADTTGTPVAVTYASVVAAGRRALWDPVSETPYSVFRRDGQWHQTWFDDPLSVTLKTVLAWKAHVAGVGAWEIAMAAGEPQMSEALLAGGSVSKLPLATGS